MYLTKGPYLQKPEKDAILILWETDCDSVGEVHVYDSYLPHVPKTATRETGEVKVFRSETAGRLHMVRVDGLNAGTEYVYEVLCESDDNHLSSGKATFRTAPEKDAAFSFVLTAEHGGVGNPNNPYLPPIRELIRRERPDFIQSVGDLTRNGTRESDWDTYLFTPFRQMLRGVPLYPCTSNHELEANATCVPPERRKVHYRNYDRYFAFPHTYSYDYGCAHFCVLDCLDFFTHIENTKQDSYIPCLRPDWKVSETYQFLEQDLRGSNAKWKFVVFHYPPYTSSQYDVRELRVLTPLFEDCGVDVVFNSHAIVYERTHPIKEDAVHPDGVRYVLVGGYEDFDRWFWEKRNPLTAKLAGRPNYVYVSLSPWRFELQAIDYEGNLFDQLVIEK